MGHRRAGRPPRGVFWRRRFVVALVVALLGWIAVAGWGRFGTPTRVDAVTDHVPPAAAAAPAARPTRPAAPSAAPTPPARPSPSPPATPSAAPTPPARPSPSPPPRPPISCTDAQVVVSLAADHPAVAAGSPVRLTATLRSHDARPCRLAVSPASVRFTIAGTGRPTWSAAACPRALPATTLQVPAGGRATLTVTWPGDVAPTSCPARRVAARPGGYLARVDVAGVGAARAALTLR